MKLRLYILISGVKQGDNLFYKIKKTGEHPLGNLNSFINDGL
jgi:hypothetical protein